LGSLPFLKVQYSMLLRIVISYKEWNKKTYNNKISVLRRALAPIRSLEHLAKCWRESLKRLGLRFRRPYCARHTSVSWNLMIGKPPLWVSRQHGHS
jgi:hypothetical protein